MVDQPHAVASAPRLAVVDDEQPICDAIAGIAAGWGFEVFACTSPSQFRQRLRESEFDVIILDLNMPGMDGVELLRELAEQTSRARIVLASGAESRVVETAFRLGRERGLDMAGILRKPIHLRELRRLLDGILSAIRKPQASETRAEPTLDSLSSDDLARGIEHDELLAYYQPQMEFSSRRVVGVEALVRWQHPMLGLLPPKAFLPLAESSGLIEPLTDWLYSAATAQCGRWRRMGLKLGVSLNLSARLPFDYEMPERIAFYCDRNGCSPECVILELTETAAMQDPVRFADVFTRLRIKGFKLSIDDFGTAYSSLVQLQRLPFTELKIDQSFVMTMLESPDSRVIVETIIALARSMGMRTVAEGIESQAVLDALAAMHCDLAQGYFISHPLPAEEVYDFCRSMPALQPAPPPAPEGVLLAPAADRQSEQARRALGNE